MTYSPLAYIPFSFGNGSTVIATGLQVGSIEVPFASLIAGITLVSTVSGDIQIDLWKDTKANIPPTIADTIVGGNYPAISSGYSFEDTTLTDWTLELAKGDIIYINVNSVATITKIDGLLKIRKVQ